MHTGRKNLLRMVAMITLLAIFLASCGQQSQNNATEQGSQSTQAAGTTESTQPSDETQGTQATEGTDGTEGAEDMPISERAKNAYAAHLDKKPGHTGGTFLYVADDTVLIVSNSDDKTYKSIDEAKAALYGSKAGQYSTNEVSEGLFLVYKTDDPYLHAIPASQGVQNAITRAYQLTDIEWTPVADMPGVDKIDGEYTVITYEAGVTYKGIPYSGTTKTDTYVGLNVTLESFLTALENENSVLYTENLFNYNNKSATYFGTVCSKFVQYALDIPGSYNTANVANIPGVKTIALPGKYTIDQIQLGDIVLHTQNHTTICTDILYDTEGNVAYIEISEAVFPRLRRKLWTPTEFFEHFTGYRLCRWQNIDDVPSAPKMLTGNEKYALMPRFGDKYNYLVSSTKGVVDILESGYSKAVVLRDGVKIDEIALTNATTKFSFDRSVPGKIEMYLEKADGTHSGSVYAWVVTLSVKAVDTSNFANGTMTVSFEGSSGTPLYVQIGSSQSIFCSIKDAENGQATISFNAKGQSVDSKFRLAYQNEYGIYLSPWKKISES